MEGLISSCFRARSACDCEFLFVYVGIYSHVALWVRLCDGVCISIGATLCMCMCVWVRGSLVSLLNIKQLEVIKYLGSTGSLWILILPFPSVSQISLFFPIFLFLFLPVTPSLHHTASIALSLLLHLCSSSPPLLVWFKLMLRLDLTLWLQSLWPCLWGNHSHLIGSLFCPLALRVIEREERRLTYATLSCLRQWWLSVWG